MSELALNLENFKRSSLGILMAIGLMAATTAVSASEEGEGTEIEGFAEAHYNNLEEKNSGTKTREMDLHRAILEIQHHFSKKVRVEVEFELEHAALEDTANGDSHGEMSVEQAFAEIKFGDGGLFKAGLFSLPVGIANKSHEPHEIYGVERNPVEKNIIPTTWRETGVLYQRNMGDFSLDVFATTGMNTTAADNYTVRGGRQQGSEAVANDLAYTATFKWKLSPAVKLGATYQHQVDMTQSTDASAGSASLLELHAQVSAGAFGVNALYATWNLDGNGPAAVGADEQSGYYLEPSFRINEKFGVFARYSQWDNQAGDNADSEMTQMDLGVNYWYMENIVFKFDYQDQDSPTGVAQLDGFNLGLGFKF